MFNFGTDDEDKMVSNYEVMAKSLTAPAKATYDKIYAVQNGINSPIAKKTFSKRAGLFSSIKVKLAPVATPTLPHGDNSILNSEV